MFKHTCVAASLLAAASLSQAGVAVPPATTYYFNANCVDCAVASNSATYGVLGTLVLDGYVEGTAIDSSNFVSFRYSGSNLLDPYSVTLTGDDGDANTVDHSFGSASGSLGAVFAAAYRVSLSFGDGLEFDTYENGEWFTCGVKDNVYYAVECSWANNQDIGLGQWGLNATVTIGPGGNRVPEPGTLALLALAALGVKTARSKQRN